MKKLVFTCALLLALAVLTAPNAEAQFCFKWVAFCDGIQIDSIVNNQINAQWYHFDCANNAPLSGGSKGEDPISNACPGGPGSGLIECNGCAGTGDVHWVIDAPLDGTLDVVQGLYPAGVCSDDEFAYVIQMGACTGLGGRQEQNRSSVEQEPDRSSIE